MSKASDLLHEINLNTFIRDGRRHLGPGQIILKLPEEQREILRTLRSDDIFNIRPDSIFYIWSKE